MSRQGPRKILLRRLICALSLLLFSNPVPAQWQTEVFFQSVYLNKFDNLITQGYVHAVKSHLGGQVYAGLWLDEDGKTGPREAFTDAQVAPLLGLRSNLIVWPALASRFFAESRAVIRTTEFPDQRDRTDLELRFGLMGHGFMRWYGLWFVENYYSFFYTHLYQDRVVLQGWARQGATLGSHLDVFHEVFVDSFDFSRERDVTLDLRPGVRVKGQLAPVSVQFLYQYLYHFSNLAFAGRDEQRITLVLGASF